MIGILPCPLGVRPRARCASRRLGLRRRLGACGRSLGQVCRLSSDLVPRAGDFPRGGIDSTSTSGNSPQSCIYNVPQSPLSPGVCFENMRRVVCFTQLFCWRRVVMGINVFVAFATVSNPVSAAWRPSRALLGFRRLMAASCALRAAHRWALRCLWSSRAADSATRAA